MIAHYMYLLMKMLLPIITRILLELEVQKCPKAISVIH